MQADPQRQTPAEQRHVAEEADQHKVPERKALSAAGVHAALLLEGREESFRPPIALAWSGLASGLTIGLSLVAEGVLRQHLPDTPWRPLIQKLGYSVGFIAVTLGRQQLYTETTLTAFLPWATDRTRETFMRMVRLWAILLATNLIGGLFFALAAAYSGAFSSELRENFRQIASESAHYDFTTALVKGIAGGWLIALMVWLMPASEGARIWVIVVLTWLLAVSGLTHIIVGSVEMFYLVTTGELSVLEYLQRYGVPVFLGNSIGGVVFVAALNHAQAITERRGVR